VLFLGHGGRDSIEAVRARGLSLNYPPDKIHYLWRESGRGQTARDWHREVAAIAPDVLYVINTAMPGLFTARWWRQFHGLPYVIDTGDVVYEMARSAGTYPAWKLPWLRLLENQMLRNAHTVVVRGSEHQAHLRAQGLPRVELIRDGYGEAAPVDTNALEVLRARLGLKGKFVAGVMGSLVQSPRLNICYGWDLVEALAQLGDLPVQGLIIGDGPGRGWLEEQARKHGVGERITFCGRIPYAEVPLYLQLLDVALSTQTNNLAGKVRTTGKLPEYMAAERYILASRVGEAARLLPPEMLIEYAGEVDRSYPQQLAQRIRQLCQNPGLLELRHTLPEVAAQQCSYAVLSRRFREVVGCICNPCEPPPASPIQM